MANSANWELEATIRVQKGHKRVGFLLQHSTDLSCRTSIYLNPEDEEIVVDRSFSNREGDIDKAKVQGPFTLFFQADEKDVETMERLHSRVFDDGDVMEIFANDRFALSTVVYSDAATRTGISCFVEGEGVGNAVFEAIKIWENLESITRQ